MAMPSGAAKVSQIDRRQNLTVLELASWHNPNATENVNAEDNSGNVNTMREVCLLRAVNEAGILSFHTCTQLLVLAALSVITFSFGC